MKNYRKTTQRKQNKEKAVAKQNVKDCVFSDLFGNKKYLRELYLALHPEDTDATDLALDVKVKMIYGDNEDDILGQYVLFTKVYDEQRKLYGRTQKTIEETIRICKERNVLKEYFESREGEVVTMMMTLFNHEQIMKNHDASIRREEREQAIANIVTIYKQVDGSMDAAIQNIMTMYGYSEEEATAIVQKYWNEVPVTINIPLSKED